MTNLKLMSMGDSAGVLLSKDLLTKLCVDKGDVLHAVETENGILLIPQDREFDAQMAVVEEIMRENFYTITNPCKMRVSSGVNWVSQTSFMIG